MKRSIPARRLPPANALQSGLSEADITARRTLYGSNIVSEQPRGGLTELLKDSARDPMLWFLLGTSALFALTGQHTEAWVMLAALLPFLGMDFYLHRRTQVSLAGLGSRMASEADTLREGSFRRIAATELVPGDMVNLAAGDYLPADGVLLVVDQLQVDESALTGESVPVRKQALSAIPARPDNQPLDEAVWGCAGTRVLAGTARLLVVYTGAETLYGDIVRTALAGSHARTPLQIAVANLVKILLGAAGALCLALAWIRWQQGHGLLDALLSALTLAVAALPEEFPVVFTFFLGAGVYRLARRQALVRRAVVVENIGRVSVICSDKTGTMTEGRLQLTHLLTASEVSPDDLLFIASAASRQETGDPVDSSILAAAARCQRRPQFNAVRSFPFTEDRKRETGIVSGGQFLLAAVKGAPETVLPLCGLDDAALRDWQDRTRELAEGGHKVLACAARELDAAQLAGGEPEQGYRFAGLLAFEDPVRAGVREAVQTCRDAGIRVIMVTGDHPATATAIARDLGLGQVATGSPTGDTRRPAVMLGDELEQRGLPDDIDVIARAVPAQKLALVHALQARGETVAVTGDGVNDVPALQAADIGIAIGERGTRSAREAAAIVLMDDNFGSIVGAIREGMQLFRNLKTSFQYLLMTHIPLVITAAIIPLAGYPLLYLPVHIILLELVIHPTAMLVFQSLPDGPLRVRRHKPSASAPQFFDRWQWAVILAVGAFISVLVTASFVRSLGEPLAGTSLTFTDANVAHARAMALAALVLSSAGITAALSGLRHRAAQVVTGFSLATLVALVQIPSLAGLLHLAPLDGDDWAIALSGAGAASLLCAGGLQLAQRLGMRRA